MPKNEGQSFEIPNQSKKMVADLFTTQEQRDDAKRAKVIDIPITEIDDFPDHPYPVEMDDDFAGTLESIKSYGVHTPALIRQKDEGRYEMISGHRRKTASDMAGYTSLPCIVKDITHDEATIMMVDCNIQRENVPPCVKGKAYKMKLDAIKRTAGRPSKENSATPLQNFEGKTSRELLAEKSPDSHEQIRKYIRLTELIPTLQNLVNAGKIALRPAVELSYLSHEHQNILQDLIGSEDCTPSHAQAIKMRKFSQDNQLNEGVIMSIMQEEKPNQVEQFKIPKERLSKYFPSGTSAEKMQSDIIKGLDLLQRQRERTRDSR